jgi:DMSO/TMAO reductase YedYZ molybdopterin-dependent catalytic subunit
METPMLSRREVLKVSAGAALAAPAFWRGALAAVPALRPDLPAGLAEVAVLDTLPGKQPLLKLSYRPPNYETPKSYLDTLITPNDAFFVRYHLAGLPEPAALEKWRLKLGGPGAEGEREVTLDQLKREFEPVEVTAVCQCAGNRRGLASPHVAGVQWGDGAMGNARWKGARLKDVLARLGIKKEAVEVVMSGADGPVLDRTPKFVKSLPLWKAMDGNALIAYEMNGEKLPYYNGYPARIVVPGWTGTYWLKHVTELQLVTAPLDNFWMRTAYRIPQGKFPQVERFTGQENDLTMPITEMVVNSLITFPNAGQSLPAGQALEIRGLAWDGGYGIAGVEVSADGGASWGPAVLGEDAGRFSVRRWSLTVPTPKPGSTVILARATNRLGESQPGEAIANPAGYHNNAVQRAAVTLT